MNTTQLESYCKELHMYITAPDVTVSTVSKGSIYWHVDHSLRATMSMLQGLQPTENPKPKFNLIKSMILWTGWIPRGAAQSPKSLTAPGPITQQSLKELFSETEVCIADYRDESSLRFEHPAFGYMNAKQILQFATIHMHHHLKIIRDITE